jgi:hypothetical protein
MKKKKGERVQSSSIVWTPDGRRHPPKKDPQNKISTSRVPPMVVCVFFHVGLEETHKRIDIHHIRRYIIHSIKNYSLCI